MNYGWEQFRIALGFLTVLPADRASLAAPAKLGRSTALFPAVGLLLGLILVVCNALLGALVPRAVLDCLLLLILVGLTGGQSLERTAGVLGSLSSGRGRESALAALQDRRVGAMGVVGLVLLLFLKYLCLFNLPLTAKTAGLIFMPAAGRWVQVVLSASCRHLRSRDKGGALFIDYVGERELLVASGSLVVAALVLFGLEGIFLFFLLGIAAVMLIKFFELRLGGILGDVLWASSEIVEVSALLLVLAVI